MSSHDEGKGFPKVTKGTLPTVSDGTGDSAAGWKGLDGRPFPTDALQPGTHLGDFRIIDIIGVGGMGVVYCAYEEALTRYVALKVLHPRFMVNKTSAERFRAEATLAANLHHKNIVPVFYIDSEDPPRFFTMEFTTPWMAGTTCGDGSLPRPLSLSDKVTTNRLDPIRTATIAWQLCAARLCDLGRPRQKARPGGVHGRRTQ